MQIGSKREPVVNNLIIFRDILKIGGTFVPHAQTS